MNFIVLCGTHIIFIAGVPLLFVLCMLSWMSVASVGDYVKISDPENDMWDKKSQFNGDESTKELLGTIMSKRKR